MKLKSLLTSVTLLLGVGLAAAAVNTWEGSGPNAAGAASWQINALALSPDGQTMYAASSSGRVLSYEFSDTTPVAFSFTDQTGVATSTVITSNAITVSGINAPATITISGGEYKIGTGSWTNASATVSAGDSVTVRHTSSASFSSSVNTVLSIGGVTDTFTSTTMAAVPTFTVTATASPAAGGTVSCTPNPVSLGGNATCTATPNAGYSFNAFSGDCSGTSCSLTGVTATKSVTASFTLNTNYSATAPGSGSTVSASLTGAATCGFSNVGYQTAASAGGVLPAGYTFTHGVLAFATNANCASGISITLTYPHALPPGSKFFKFGPATAGAAPTWYEHPATISGNTITYSVADNGQGDNNPAVGAINDPAGAGVPLLAGVSSVPTLSEWALLLLSLLLVGTVNSQVLLVRGRAMLSGLWRR
ncbi:IPTL-CTERM sorting domain-containing protein [Rhodoferax sp.]|uniref:IPTL-CTERM sorting domain-containing protein n=1 Tax=Rhodoferax sp. TaxID=50421 RepID=UPI00260BDDD0|nr:IPTL-CTERM sorting domain-containing protein [Rhodoferax sp.]MDD2923633.1 IPTL-CTERM sorting domain-containing protein [Rhodoferax sp.]